MKEIVIDISDDGEVRFETAGFKGKACIEETEFLKKLLGKETLRRLIPAYYNLGKKVVKKYLQLCG
jgi:hypothetical protein